MSKSNLTDLSKTKAAKEEAHRAKVMSFFTDHPEMLGEVIIIVPGVCLAPEDMDPLTIIGTFEAAKFALLKGMHG